MLASIKITKQQFIDNLQKDAMKQGVDTKIIDVSVELEPDGKTLKYIILDVEAKEPQQKTVVRGRG